jgi:hypothetical protein
LLVCMRTMPCCLHSHLCLQASRQERLLQLFNVSQICRLQRVAVRGNAAGICRAGCKLRVWPLELRRQGGVHGSKLPMPPPCSAAKQDPVQGPKGYVVEPRCWSLMLAVCW